MKKSFFGDSKAFEENHEKFKELEEGGNRRPSEHEQVEE